MRRRDLLRWSALAPVAALAGPVLAKAGAVASRVAPRVPRVEWVWEADGRTKSLVIDHATLARFGRGVVLSEASLARYVAERAALARAATSALRLLP